MPNFTGNAKPNSKKFAAPAKRPAGKPGFQAIPNNIIALNVNYYSIKLPNMTNKRNYRTHYAALQQDRVAEPLVLGEGRVKIEPMGEGLNVVILILIGLTAVVLLAGVATLFRSGQTNRNLSNRLMRWRVLLQFAAVLAMAVSAFWFGRN